MAATATKPAPARRPKWLMDVPVAFGNVSFGDGTCRIGCKVDREVLNIEAADEALSGTRIKGRIVLGGNGDARGQSRMSFDKETMIEAIFDCKGFSANAKRIGFGLTANLVELKDRIEQMAGYSKHDGRFQVASVAALAGPEDAEDDEDEEEGEDSEDEE